MVRLGRDGYDSPKCCNHVYLAIQPMVRKTIRIEMLCPILVVKHVIFLDNTDRLALDVCVAQENGHGDMMRLFRGQGD